jgi:predicted HicB family RNase H-like nuclease
MTKRRRGRNLSVRDVPIDAHERLTAAAKKAGSSLSEYLKRELDDSTRRHEMQQIFERNVTRDRAKGF